MKTSHKVTVIASLLLGSLVLTVVYLAPGRTRADLTQKDADMAVGHDRSATGHASHGRPTPASGQWLASDFSDESPGEATFAAENVRSHLNGFFARLYTDKSLTMAEKAAFAYRLGRALEEDKAARKVVADYYSAIPSKQMMERDVMRDMLAVSPAGRAMMLDEAKRIWETRDKDGYQHMYETYAGFPGQAPPAVMSEAIADLSDRDASSGTTVAALNLVSTLEKDDSPNAARMRSAAISQMTSVASNGREESVRGIAAQKIYQLSSPENAADIATGFLRKDAGNGWMIDQTLYAISSGDVELTPALRSALSSAVSLPSVSRQALAHYNSVVIQKH